MSDDCYAYIRQTYGVPAFVGRRVRAIGRDGVLVEAPRMRHYLHVRLDCEDRVRVYHPTYEIEYAQVEAEG